MFEQTHKETSRTLNLFHPFKISIDEIGAPTGNPGGVPININLQVPLNLYNFILEYCDIARLTLEQLMESALMYSLMQLFEALKKDEEISYAL